MNKTTRYSLDVCLVGLDSIHWYSPLNISTCCALITLIDYSKN